MNSTQDTLAGGLPHSEIPGSTIARISPELFAACHVLHRLSVPRHPPDALPLRLSATPNGKDHIRCSQRLHRAARPPSWRKNARTPTSLALVIGATNPPSPGGAVLRRFRRHFIAGPCPATPPDTPVR